MRTPIVRPTADIIALLTAEGDGKLPDGIIGDITVSLDSAQNLGGGRRRPIATFAKIYASVTAPSLVNFMAMGDSIAEFKPKHLCSLIARTMTSNTDSNTPNTAGTGQQTFAGCFCGVGTNSNYTLLASQWSYWPTGEIHRITSGGSTTWLYGGVNPTFTKLKVVYITEPGAGVLTVTVGGVLKATIDTGTGFNSIGLGIYNFTQALSQQSIVIACTSGTVKFVEVHKLDDTVSGINYLIASQSGVSLDNEMSTVTGRANFQTYLTDAAPDLITYEAKEASIEPNGTTFAFNLGLLGDLIDASCPNADKVMIGSTPVAVNDADQVVCNATLNTFAQARGYIYWDGYTPIGSYAKMLALGWQGDGVHAANQCNAYLASLMFRDLGFDRFTMGLTPRAVSDRGTASALARGTSFGRAPGTQLTLDTDSQFGLDWRLALPRSLRIGKDDVTGTGTVAATAGAATFSTSQSGLLVAGNYIQVGLVEYLIVTFDGTTGATLSGSPTFGASAFTIRVQLWLISSNTATHPNVIPSKFRFDSENPGPGALSVTIGSQTFLKLEDTARTAPSLLPIQPGAVYAGPYTVAQLPAISNSIKGALAVASDGAFDGTQALMMAHGLSTTDWVPVLYGIEGVENHGDVALTLTRLNAMTQRWTAPLTVNRAVAFNANTNNLTQKFHIERTAASTGAFTLDIGPGPLKSLATGQWCDLEYSVPDAAWQVRRFGSL